MRVSNWAFNPRRALFARLGAVYGGGLERGGLTVCILQGHSDSGDNKRLEISLSLEEAKRLHEKVGQLIKLIETANAIGNLRREDIKKGHTK